MADIGMPDTLTPEQMKKLGGASHPDDLPDTLTDEEMGKLTAPKPSPEDDLRARADAIDRRHASHGLGASDDDLGISSPLAQPKGNLKYLLPPQDLPADYKAEPGLNHEDPAMALATTLAGAGAGRAVGYGIGKLSPVAAKIVEPAVAGAATSYLGHGGRPTLADVKAGGIGAALGVPGAALQLVRSAPAAVAERLPGAVTGGLKSKAAKQVVAGAPIEDVLDQHPELKRVLATSGDVGTKFNATASTLNKLSSANDTVYDAIQAQHQGIPLDSISKRIDAVAQRAHTEGDEVLEKAAESAKENLQRYGDVADKRGPIASATQVRGVRNNLARKVQALNPTLGPTEAQAAADEIRKAINEGIEDIAGQTKGVDVAALRQRNKQIAQLLPMQRTLREQAIAAKLLPAHDPLADLIEHPSKTVAGLARAIPAHADAALANSPRLQRLAGAPLSPLQSFVGTQATGGFAARAAKPRQDENDFAARVAQLMKDMPLEEAMKRAEEQ